MNRGFLPYCMNLAYLSEFARCIAALNFLKHTWPDSPPGSGLFLAFSSEVRRGLFGLSLTGKQSGRIILQGSRKDGSILWGKTDSRVSSKRQPWLGWGSCPPETRGHIPVNTVICRKELGHCVFIWRMISCVCLNFRAAFLTHCMTRHTRIHDLSRCLFAGNVRMPVARNRVLCPRLRVHPCVRRAALRRAQKMPCRGEG